MDTIVEDVQAEYRRDTTYVPVAEPRLSWRVRTSGSGWSQRAVELEWSTQGISTRQTLRGGSSTLVDWPFPALAPRQRGHLRLRVTGTDGATSPWSDGLEIRGGHLDADEWVADFVGLASPTVHAQPFLVRRSFDVRDHLVSATLYATARGVYQVEINGRAVDAHELKPGWTAYQDRLLFETTDVTHLVAPGSNVWGASVAGGWFTENYGFDGSARPFYGTQASFAGQVVLTYPDATEVIRTGDSGWVVSTEGPITASGIYAGEAVDGRRRDGAWSSAGASDERWSPASVVAGPDLVPEPVIAPPVRVTEKLPAVCVLTSPGGSPIVDFGQNLVGRLRLRVQGVEGQEVVIRHAEVLQDGELATRPLRLAQATDRFICSGTGVETFEPQFTFHGFRYAQIDGLTHPLEMEDVEAVALHTDMRRTGWFACSDELIDQLHRNVVWGMRGNFLSLPTDCPQRDERLGWTGDIQVFAPTASFLYDCDGLLASWLRDLAREQSAGGGVPFTVPDPLQTADLPAAGWGDAATVVPTVLWHRFGDRQVLERQFHSMKAWVDQVAVVAGEDLLWEGSFQFGDWLDPDAPPDKPGRAKADPDVLATGYFHRSARLVAEAAAELGLSEEAKAYATLAEDIRAAWMRAYVTSDGRIVSDAPTTYAVAIIFGLYPDERTKKEMGDRLARLVRQRGYVISTGFIGTPILLDALVRSGHVRAASRLLRQRRSPSWLYPVTMGATTVWERWDSMLPDGTVNPGEMTSFNHYALGAVADWLHGGVAGLSSSAPGWRRIMVRPTPIPGLTWAEASHDTPLGRASVRWESTGGVVRVTATIPPGAEADVHLPGRASSFTVGSGAHRWEVPIEQAPLPRGELTLDSPLADVIDDEDAFEALLAAVAATDPPLLDKLVHQTAWVPERTLRSELLFVRSVVVAAVEEALVSASSPPSSRARPD